MNKLKNFRILTFMIILSMVFANIASAAVKIPDTRNIKLYQISREDGKKEGVTITRGSKKTFKGAEGSAIGAKDKVTTDSKTKAYLEIDGKKVVVLDKSTSISVSKASSKKLSITLSSGQIYFDTKGKLPDDSELEFSAGGTTMGVRGTDGSYGVSGDGEVQTTILSGAVQVTTKSGQTIIVTAGHYQIINGDGTKATEQLPIDPKKINGFILEAIINDIKKDTTTEDELKNQEMLKELLNIKTEADLEQLVKDKQAADIAENEAKTEKDNAVDEAKKELENISKEVLPDVGSNTKDPIIKDGTTGGGGASVAPPITLIGTITMVQLTNALATNNNVTIGAGAIATLGAVRLVIAPGKSLTVASGGTLDSLENLDVAGTMINYGTMRARMINNTSMTSFYNNGEITAEAIDNTGKFVNTASNLSTIVRCGAGSVFENSGNLTAGVEIDGDGAKIINTGNMAEIANTTGVGISIINHGTIDNISNDGTIDDIVNNGKISQKIANMGTIKTINNNATLGAIVNMPESLSSPGKIGIITNINNNLGGVITDISLGAKTTIGAIQNKGIITKLSVWTSTVAITNLGELSDVTGTAGSELSFKNIATGVVKAGNFTVKISGTLADLAAQTDRSVDNKTFDWIGGAWVEQ